MAKFVCKSCNYRFKTEAKSVYERCPYCDEKTVIKEPSAEELLKDE